MAKAVRGDCLETPARRASRLTIRSAALRSIRRPAAVRKTGPLLLTAAFDQVCDVRIAARRGDLAAVAAPLAADVDALLCTSP